ncbi:hypothetical protein ACQP2P_29410 [Dactylosporangium sp. CA-139114]|uniref:hypothetical protein n=1 Tax=Dactylosporangium sp. CA-139114 TaxID=3239931 RepID=UPI003D980091
MATPGLRGWFGGDLFSLHEWATGDAGVARTHLTPVTAGAGCPPSPVASRFAASPRTASSSDPADAASADGWAVVAAHDGR